MNDTSLLRCHCGINGHLINWAPIAFVLLLFTRFYFKNDLINFSSAVIGVLYGYYLLIILLPELFKKSAIMIFLILMIISWLMNVWVGVNEVWIKGMQYFSNFGFAIALLSSRLDNRIYTSLFIAFIVFVSYHILRGINPEDVFTVSRNFFSILYILILSLYYISALKTNNEITLLAPIVGVVISIWAVGRAGIFSGFIILAATIIISKKYIYLFIFIIGAIFLFVVTNFEYFDSLSLLEGFNRIQRLGFDGERNNINYDYLLSAFFDSFTYIFGANINLIPSIIDVDGNAHNSFINLHVVFGALGFFVLLFSLIYSTVILCVSGEYILLMLLIVSIFRSAVDSSAFYGPLDIIILYCLLRSWAIGFTKN